MYTTFPYIYSVAAAIHGGSPLLSKAFIQDRHGDSFYNHLEGIGLRPSEWAPHAYISRGVHSVFNTTDYEPTLRNVKERLIFVYNAFPEINKGSLDGLPRFLDTYTHQMLQHLNQGTYFSGTTDLDFILNNLLNMFRKLPLVIDRDTPFELT